MNFVQPKPKNRLVDLIFNNIKIVFLLFVFLVVFGFSSVAQMQRQGFPDVAINVAIVRVIYPNASAEQIEDEVIKPIESAIKGLDDVTEYESIISESFGVTTVTFETDVDVDEAIAKLNDEISAVELPEDAQDPVVNKITISGSGEIMVAAAGYHDEWALYEAGQNLADEMSTIDGIQAVNAINPLTPEVVITFSVDDLAEHGVTRAAAEEVLQTARFSAPVGSFESDDTEVSVILDKELLSLEEIEDLYITADVQIKDVATITTRLNNNDKYNRIGYKLIDDLEADLQIERALVYGLKLEDDADILTVAAEVDDRLNELELEAQEAVEYDLPDGKGDGSTRVEPDNPEFLVTYSQADQTEQQLGEITQSIFGRSFESWGPLAFLGYLFGGLGLVALLLFVFMNWRVALMAALAVPLSLCFASIYLSFAGIALNTIVLFSMVLTIGLVVDPTIVFLESLQRYREQGFDGRDAAAKTVSTVGLGIFLAVMTNILVFVPFGVITGFFGEIISYIPLTVIPAMIASMLIPVVFFMPVASKLIKPRRKRAQHTTDLDNELVGTWRVGRLIGQVVQWILGAGKAKVILRFVIFAFIMAMPFALGGILIETGAIEVVQFSTTEDADYIMVTGEVSDEWTFERAVYDVVVPLQDELKNYPEIMNFSYYEQSGNSFTMLIQLHSIADREEADMRNAAELLNDINVDIDALDLDANIELLSDSGGPPQEVYPIKVRLYDQDSEKLAHAAEDIKDFLASVDGVSYVEDNLSGGSSGGTITYVLASDEQAAQNPYLIYGLMSERLAQNDLGELTADGVDYDIVSTMTPAITTEDELTSLRLTTTEDIIYEQTIAQLEAAGVPNPETLVEAPEPVYIEDVLAEAEIEESHSIYHFEGQRYVEVYAAIDDDANALDIQTELQEFIDHDQLEDWELDEEAIDYEGEADAITDSFTDLFLALIIAIFLIYVLLVGFFRSFLEPFIILFAIPLGLVGVFLAVLITTGQLGFMELLGVVAMAGIVVNVTILLIDFANQLKRSGKSPAEAIATAVAVRFRPIVLTQMTAFGSMLPLVIISPYWQGLAASIICGIVSSALLSLLLTPILYQWSNTIVRHSIRLPHAPGWLARKIKRN